ncbi:MAG: hypothetical protein P4L35_18150 [Ignavibacteriaceae bacterium]|nr:hypothetical protein [Ignavibacteriaceae bacterium]
MKFSFNRNQFIVALFSLVIFLLLLNIILSKIYKHTLNHPEKVELFSGEIRDRFISALHNYGIRNDWVDVNKNDIKFGDSLKYSFKVKVPRDLPIALLLNEISNSFQPGEINSTSRETKSNGTTYMFLSSGGFDKLKTEFDYDPDIRRTSFTFGFLVYGLNSLDQNTQDQIIRIPELYIAVLAPSKESLELSKKLKVNDKNYAVILNNDIKDLDYKLSSSYSPERLKLSIRSILGDFSNPVAYLINGNSGFSSESSFPFISKEFEIRNIKFIDINRFNLIEEKGSPIDVAFRQIIDQAKENITELIYISAGNYIQLQPLMLEYKKIGYKFVNPSPELSEYLK